MGAAATTLGPYWGASNTSIPAPPILPVTYSVKSNLAVDVRLKNTHYIKLYIKFDCFDCFSLIFAPPNRKVVTAPICYFQSGPLFPSQPQ